MGVSAKAARPEMAKDFIQTLLSYEVMAFTGGTVSGK